MPEEEPTDEHSPETSESSVDAPASTKFLEKLIDEWLWAIPLAVGIVMLIVVWVLVLVSSDPPSDKRFTVTVDVVAADVSEQEVLDTLGIVASVDMLSWSENDPLVSSDVVRVWGAIQSAMALAPEDSVIRFGEEPSFSGRVGYWDTTAIRSFLRVERFTADRSENVSLSDLENARVSAPVNMAQHDDRQLHDESGRPIMLMLSFDIENK